MRILIFLLPLLALAAGCRCQSKMMTNPEPGQAGTVSPETVTGRWCRACAVRSFLACKRIDGTGTEEQIKRRAEESACKDVGFSPQECTKDRIRFEECGLAQQ